MTTGCSCGGHLTVLDRAHIAVSVDEGLYSAPALLRSAYKFTDRIFILLERRDGQLVAYLMGKTSTDDLADIAGQFCNELVDQELREALEQRFAPVRNLITAQAFAEGNLLESLQDNADPNADPLGIGTSR